MISDQINVHIARELGSLDREHRVHVKKLSAGKRILLPGDDTGGYSLAVKHGSAGRRNQAMPVNLQMQEQKEFGIRSLTVGVGYAFQSRTNVWSLSMTSKDFASCHLDLLTS